MIEIAKGREAIERALDRLKCRAQMSDEAQRQTVLNILKDVREEGDSAVSRYTEKFDGAVLRADEFRVSQEEMDSAMRAISPQLLDVLKKSAENIRRFHEMQKQKTWLDIQPHAMLGQMVQPIQNVGVYVPGGRAAYPSTVLMNVIPAHVAGVERIVMVTPPNADGKIDYVRLAAAKLAGATEIYKMGGAQSIGALAYGTQTIRAVDKITGPGNIYVALAKREVFGVVGIDMMAGPSEILIIADGDANPRYIAADMLAQAEHDPLAAAICVTNSEQVAEQIQEELEKQTTVLSRKEIIRQSLEQYGTIAVTGSLEEAFDMANAIAPEHLEVLVKEPLSWLGHVRNAGAIFLGEYTPEAYGDYLAGPNHTLPTNGTARFASPLSVDDFIKKSSILNFSKEQLQANYRDIAAFANAEGLEAHAKSAEIRFE